MADTGPDLIAAITGKQRLLSVNNCPGVSAQLSHAVYGSSQSDTGDGTVIRGGDNMNKQISTAIGFGGANSETAVWHFILDPVHHFAVVPWYRHSAPHGQVYTVFMAYENRYTLGQYIGGTGGRAPAAGGRGYKTVWTPDELSTMFSELLTDGAAWQNYFGLVGAAQATKITYWKYKIVTLKSAISNVNKY